jgi:hypothetical protein
MELHFRSAETAPENEKMKKVDPETVKLLRGFTEEEWLTWYNALVVIAKRECKKRYWRTGKDEHLPKGYSPETVVQEAIARLFDGRRQWDHLEYPGNSRMGILRATVESIMGDLVRSQEHKRYAYLESAADDGDDGDSEGRADRLVHRSQENAYQLSLPPDRSVYLSGVVSRIQARVKDRPDLGSYLTCLDRGLKRGEIADEMKVSTDRVDELRKQFLARTEDIYQELFGQELFGGKQQVQKKGGA